MRGCAKRPSHSGYSLLTLRRGVSLTFSAVLLYSSFELLRGYSRPETRFATEPEKRRPWAWGARAGLGCTAIAAKAAGVRFWKYQVSMQTCFVVGTAAGIALSLRSSRAAVRSGCYAPSGEFIV